MRRPPDRYDRYADQRRHVRCRRIHAYHQVQVRDQFHFLAQTDPPDRRNDILAKRGDPLGISLLRRAASEHENLRSRNFRQPDDHALHHLGRIDLASVLSERRHADPPLLPGARQFPDGLAHRIAYPLRQRNRRQIEAQLQKHIPVTLDRRFQLNLDFFFRRGQSLLLLLPLIYIGHPRSFEAHQLAQSLAPKHVVQVGDQIETPQIAAHRPYPLHPLVPPLQVGSEKGDVRHLPEERLQKLGRQHGDLYFGILPAQQSQHGHGHSHVAHGGQPDNE